MTYSAQERLDILKRTIETNSKRVTLNGVEYEFSPLAIAGIKLLNTTLDDKENAVDAWVKLALLSISRTTPDITEEELDIAIDSSNFSLVQSTLLNLSGYVTKQEDAPNVQVATETQEEEVIQDQPQ